VTTLSGNMFIAGTASTGLGQAFRGINPATGEELAPSYHEASAAQVNDAVFAAEVAFRVYSRTAARDRARFLRMIADELLATGDELLQRANAETGLPLARLESERARAANQLVLMAEVLEEGSWVDARVDTGNPARTPAPKPDLRRMLVALGPVAVFSASNFPFAYSVVGGDTASALAAGCSVVCKAHPAHPGTSELTAIAINRAVVSAGMPVGVFSMIQGWSHEVGVALVTHPLIQAVGFTGSLKGGRAIFDAAAARSEPIPVYAEMGSVNPVFLLPSAVKERSAEIAKGLAASMTQGVGQFCTNPGVIVGVDSESFRELARTLAANIRETEPGVMLYDGLFKNFTAGVARTKREGASVLAEGHAATLPTRAQAVLLGIDAAHFSAEANLRHEMFGPASVIVTGENIAELEAVAENIEGQLTASIHGTDEELAQHANLVAILQRKAGRLIFNGYPTGVEVGHAMQHGGPYPASTDSRTTSVGSASIGRFARPVCFQNFPDSSLPPELKNENTAGIWRMLNGALTKDSVA
jgi:alpha-ketoglutaric semialdehyde dehydrogenase